MTDATLIAQANQRMEPARSSARAILSQLRAAQRAR